MVTVLLCELLTVLLPLADSPVSQVQHILLIDATRLKEPVGTGDDWRVHLGYDLLGGRLVGVRVADRRTAEAFELFVVDPGDVLVADRGYSRRSQFAYALRRGTQMVVRLVVQQVPLLDEQRGAWTWWAGSKRLVLAHRADRSSLNTRGNALLVG